MSIERVIETIQGDLESVYIIVEKNTVKRVNGLNLKIYHGLDIVKGYAVRDYNGLKTDHIYIDDNIYSFETYQNYLMIYDVSELPVSIYESKYVFTTYEEAEKVLVSILSTIISDDMVSKCKILSEKYPEGLI